ncbi:hypothetical protein PR202_gb18174 [Eleusine coracana subsp. coracana]|uniref:Uncharacterized protein n=1 Tax=Eleusine coracana subsp. coracana TaxID=191504 RepID=A0AAV5F6P8_ELECO|nr:hypothetical protein PR202_gb18174 [Eleusine coracana subsp. coracana]
METRVIINPNRQPMETHFFEHAVAGSDLYNHFFVNIAAVETMDITKILTLQGGEAAYPLPRIKNLAVHPKLNLAAVIFADMSGTEAAKNKAAYTREGRRQLFSLLQGARGSTAAVLKEKLLALGSSGILAEHQLQAQLQEQHLKGQSQLTISDVARKAFLHSIPSNMECHPKNMSYSPKQHLFLVVFELSGPKGVVDEVVLYWEQTDLQTVNSKGSSIRGSLGDQLFVKICSGITAAVLKEKLLALGSSGILAEHQLQAQLQEQHLKGQSQLTISDVARKAFLHSHFMEGHAKSGPICRLPLVTISEPSNLLRDVPVCQPFHLELNFFNQENRVVQYPVRAFYLDGFNLMAHNLSSGSDNLYKKLYSTIPSNMECHPKNMSYSPKQHLFLVVFELSGPKGVVDEVVLYWEQTDLQTVNSKGSSIRGRDAAFLGPDDNQYAILEEDRTGLNLFNLKAHIGLAKLLQGYRLSTDNGLSITTKTDGKKFIKLKPTETVLQPLTTLYYRSMLWVGPALIFSSATAVSMLGWDNKVRSILSTSFPRSESLLYFFLVWVEFPCMLHWLILVSCRFDSLRITPRSLDILARGPPVCGDLAVSLSQAGPQFTQIMRCNYAIKALKFSTALSILKDEFLRSRDYPQCPPTSHLFQRFRELGYACIKYVLVFLI